MLSGFKHSHGAENVAKALFFILCKKGAALTIFFVNATAPEELETQNDFYENEMEKLFEELDEETEPKVRDAVYGFVYLAEEMLTVTERNRILELLERLEYEGDGEAALDMLYGMFLASGLKEHAKSVLDAIRIGEEYQIVYMSFMEDFFEDAAINNYLISNWLMAEGEEESAGGVLS